MTETVATYRTETDQDQQDQQDQQQTIRAIKDARAMRGLSQQALATELEVSIDTVREIEQGRRKRIKGSTYQSLCRVLGLGDRDLAGLRVYEGRPA